MFMERKSSIVKGMVRYGSELVNESDFGQLSLHFEMGSGLRPSEPSPHSKNVFSDLGMLSPECSRYSNGSDTLGLEKLSDANRRSGSLFDIGHTAELMTDGDYPLGRVDSGESGEISRCGSWPFTPWDNLDEVTLRSFREMESVTSIGFKDAGDRMESSNDSSIIRSKKFIDMVCRTLGRKGRRPLTENVPECPNDNVAAAEERWSFHWRKLIRGVRHKRWGLINAGSSLKNTEPHNGTSDDGSLSRHLCTVVEIAKVNGATGNRLDKASRAGKVDRTRSKISSCKQYAVFRPLASTAKPLSNLESPDYINSSTFIPSAVVRKGHRKDDVVAINYGLVRIRETGDGLQVYDCVDRDTGGLFTVKLIPKNALSVEIYEQLCEKNHESFVRVVQVLEDTDLFYILMDFSSSVYLKELYYSSHPKAFDESLLRAIIRQILKGLAYLHRKGMGLGNLSLDSVIINLKDTNLVLAKIYNLDGAFYANKVRPMVQKDAQFDAPEIALGVSTYASDLWSCGVLLYILVEGRAPFRNLETSSHEERLAFMRANPPSFSSELWMRCPGMRDFCLELLQPDYRKRFSTAMEAFIHPWVNPAL